jgi:hypothetical protein
MSKLINKIKSIFSTSPEIAAAKEAVVEAANLKLTKPVAKPVAS